MQCTRVTLRLPCCNVSNAWQANQARLDALENDNDAGDALAADSADEEVVLHDDDDGDDGGERGGRKIDSMCLTHQPPSSDDDGPGSSKKGRKGKKGGSGTGSKRKLRGATVGARGPKSFSRLLEDVSPLAAQVQLLSISHISRLSHRRSWIRGNRAVPPSDTYAPPRAPPRPRPLASSAPSAETSRRK